MLGRGGRWLWRDGKWLGRGRRWIGRGRRWYGKGGRWLGRGGRCLGMGETKNSKKGQSCKKNYWVIYATYILNSNKVEKIVKINV